jgi:hypothetical protein
MFINKLIASELLIFRTFSIYNDIPTNFIFGLYFIRHKTKGKHGELQQTNQTIEDAKKKT